MKKLSLFALVFASVLGTVDAYPPAPHHLVFGMIRDELGNPIQLNTADVQLETTAGNKIKAPIQPGLRGGVNYEMPIPMDSGLTAENYRATALRPTVPFKMKVVINGVAYLPIEMSGNYSQLGRPSASTRIDLTLGEDANGNGLPDAWERATLAAAGSNANLADFKANGDLDGDGLSNLDEYIAGTYAFDPEDGFVLKIAGHKNGSPIMEFLSIRGRTYSLLGSQDMKTWLPIPFKAVDSEGPTAPEYYAPDVRKMQVEAPETAAPAYKFFKLKTR